MCRFTFLVFSFLVYEKAVFSASVDQRQTGDLNVQIDLKNLQIVGLLKGKEEYVDYDYAYDYSDMTIKPSSGTTKKPLNVTDLAVSVKDNTTAATTVFAELNQTTSSIENGALSTETLVSTTPKMAANDSSIVINTTTPSSQDPVTNNNSTTNSNCKKGFFRNSNGNCELKLQNPSNAILKMIKEKLKSNGSNGGRRM